MADDGRENGHPSMYDLLATPGSFLSISPAPARMNDRRKLPIQPANYGSPPGVHFSVRRFFFPPYFSIHECEVCNGEESSENRGDGAGFSIPLPPVTRRLIIFKGLE